MISNNFAHILRNFQFVTISHLTYLLLGDCVQLEYTMFTNGTLGNMWRAQERCTLTDLPFKRCIQLLPLFLVIVNLVMLSLWNSLKHFNNNLSEQSNLGINIRTKENYWSIYNKQICSFCSRCTQLRLNEKGQIYCIKDTCVHYSYI